MVDIPKTFVPTPIDPPGVDACLTRSQINGFCAEYGTYSDTVTLPPIPGGYDMAWTRCCRNNAITNLIFQEGITLLSHIPTDLVTQNASPVFNNLAPMFLCAGQPFVFDHAATDSDGDSLVYVITDPFASQNFQGIGTSQTQPTVNRVDTMGPPPYQHVNYINPFHYLDPFGTGDFQVDKNNGLLTLTPDQPGLFVFAVSVLEYRGGILLSENKRDFQIHVLPCKAQGTPPEISSDISVLPQFSNDSVFVRNDTIVVQPGRPFCYPAVLIDPTPEDTVIMIPISSWFGVGGNGTPPFATLTQRGVNPAYGEICWTPNCDLAGQYVNMIIGGYDPHDCFGYNVVFDTVVILIAGANPPILTHQLPNGGDTAWVKTGEYFCYDFVATDIDPFDGLVVTPTAGPFVNLGGSAVKQDTGVNPVKGTVCWTPTCDDANKMFIFELTAVDTNFCNVSHPVTDQVVVHVISDEPPVTYIDEEVFECDPESRVRLTALGGDRVVWSDGYDQRSRIESPATASRLIATVYNGACEGISDSVDIIERDPFPIAEFTASSETGIAPVEVQFLNLSQKAVRYRWDFGEGRTPNFEEEPRVTFQAGTWDVQLIAFSEEGCTDTAQAKLDFEHPALHVPTAFSPNGDGVNDQFYVGNYGLSKFDFRVYTRWGLEIFHTQNPAFKWDGNYRGVIVPEGVYVYKLVITDEANRRKVQTGTVTVIM